MTITPDAIEIMKLRQCLGAIELQIFTCGCEAMADGEISAEGFKAHAMHLLERHWAGFEITQADLRGFRKLEVAA